MTTSAELDLGRLALPAGGFAMVAIDQRESLRNMFADATGGTIDDATLVDFKVAVAERLAPLASAILFDRHFALKAFDATASVPTCGRILAADEIRQQPGQPLDDTGIDFDVDPVEARERGAVALKQLVLWRGEENREACIEIATTFLERCRSAGLPGIVEAIVREPQGGGAFDREREIVAAARDLGATRPALYKCEVPFHGEAGDAAVASVCEEITAVLDCPWVVLSQGVASERFPSAVEVACRAGASGFLAGRAIWADAIAEDDYRPFLDDVSVTRLRRLVETVNASARSWQAAAGADRPA